MKKSTLITFSILALLLSIIAAISWWVFDWEKVSAGIWELLGKAITRIPAVIVDILAIIAFIINIIEPSQTTQPLLKTTPDKICNDLGSGGNIRWVNRERTSIDDLKGNGRVLISGKMKQGKTREAAELIRRAIRQEIVNEKYIFQPDPIVIAAGFTQQSLFKDVDATQSILLFIDDLPFHYSGKNQLDKLSEALDRLKFCKELYIVATARNEQMTKAHRRWIKKHALKTVRFGGLKPEHMEEFLDAASQVYGLQLDDEARKVLLTSARRDTRPETLRVMLNLLTEDMKIKQVDGKTAQQVAKKSLRDSYQIIRRETVKFEPAAAYLFEALAALHTARITPQANLVIGLTKSLIRITQDNDTPFQIGKRLWRALAFLETYDTVIIEQKVKYPDPLVENLMGIQEALQMVDQFLYTQLTWRTNRFLRWLFRKRAVFAKAAFELAYAYQREEDHWNAIDYYTYCIQLDPDDTAAYSLRGIAYTDKGDLDLAIQNYTKVIQLNPDDAFAYNNRGLAYAEKGDLDLAIQDYTKAILVDPNDAYSYNNRGTAYFFISDDDLALHDYNKAIKLDSDDATAYINRSNCLMRGKQLAEAEADVTKAEELAKDHPYTHARRALLLFLQGNYDAALKKYKIAQSLEEDPTEFSFDIALPLLCLGHLEDALGLIQARLKQGTLPHEIKDALFWFEDLKAQQPDLPGLDEALEMLREKA